LGGLDRFPILLATLLTDAVLTRYGNIRPIVYEFCFYSATQLC